MTNKLLISNIKIKLGEDESVAIELARKELKRAGVKDRGIDFRIYKKSIDARNKNDIMFVYTVLASSDCCIPARTSSNIKPADDEELKLEFGDEMLPARPCIVGMGPAGMFCALLLAENGYAPVLIDRGDSVADRVRALEKFIQSEVLDTDSNVQFGAGGAGTFSDGKLTTRINDSRCAYVLKRFAEFGAPTEIMTRAKPHIGTDILCRVVENILDKIEDLGGTVLYRCRMDGIASCGDTVELTTSKGSIKAGVAVLALGHSARDTYRMLLSKNFAIQPKPFSVGVRVEHLQKDIDRALFGEFAGHSMLGPAEYNLSDTKSERGVYTFCMCPGGEVVPATSQEGGVVVNGMSRFARDGKNANCAVAVSVKTSDYGETPEGAIAFQENLEKRAYIEGGGDYFAPVQLMGDFLNDRTGAVPSRIMPTYAGGEKCRVADLSAVLPDFVSKRLKEGFLSFDKKIKGFAVPDAVLTGVETRTSAPVRILRSENMTAIGNPLIYPCGEGAGYAGGIMSAAVDGIKVAIEIMKKYKP